MNSRMWEKSELGKEAFNASRPFSFKTHPEVVFINTGDVFAGNFLHSACSVATGLPGQAKKAIRPNDILLTEIRPGNGRYAFVDFAAEKYVVSTKFMVIETRGRLLAKFLFHVLTNQSALDEFQRIAESRSGTFPQITFDSIEHFPVPVPPIDEQEKLTQFFDTLNDRIALLRETNATLEAIAQALFKSWFVDFDPVRAKIEGRAPEGMDEATAALFPNDFEESALGALPRGWKVGSILDIAKLLSGGTPKTAEPDYWGGDIPWASAKDVSQCNGTVLMSTERTITARGLNESSTRMIPGLATCVVARGATTGRMVLLGNEMAMNQTCYALESRTKTPIALYCQLRREIGALVNAAHGSVFDTITTDTFVRSRIVQPPSSLVGRFEEIVGPIFERIIAGTRSTATLIALRDTLLPRLMSGQLRLPDIDKFAEAMTGT